MHDCPSVVQADPTSEALAELLAEVLELRNHALEFESELEPAIVAAHREQRPSARNLVHYLGLRQRDLRSLQDRLAAVGLSSLGRSESQVLPALETVLFLLRRLLGRPQPADQPAPPLPTTSDGEQRLGAHLLALLGAEPETRRARIMVTIDGATLTQPGLVRKLVASGMDCARINCAHDDPETWQSLARQVREAAAELNRPCRVDMDLPGPKLRTGPIAPQQGVVHWRVRRGLHGEMAEPARVWLTPEEAPEPLPATAQVGVPLPAAWLTRVRTGDALLVQDTRARERHLQVVSEVGSSRLAESDQGAYVSAGARVHRIAPKSRRMKRSTRVGALPTVEQPLVLRTGDTLDITGVDILGGPAELDASGAVVRAAHIPCTEPLVFRDVHVGEPIWFDDGKIGGVVRRAAADGLGVHITKAAPRGSKLRADKGINLPESELHLPALGQLDLRCLDVAAAYADLVALSFANSPEDVAALRTALEERTDRRLGIVLKIETRRGFENMPRLLLEALRSRPVGVMIARGDLAVECGYARLAEVQEEMLWLCEAAHIPVIWATQVLDQLAKTGRPSRAEITDAAMGARAECVMLNKGPHTVEAVQVLDNILRRMQMHQRKKRALFRRLEVSFTSLSDLETLQPGGQSATILDA